MIYKLFLEIDEFCLKNRGCPIRTTSVIIYVLANRNYFAAAFSFAFSSAKISYCSGVNIAFNLAG
ncbi:MAG: hypothetical protein RLZZ540_44 [Bacteroidota bacterium]